MPSNRKLRREVLKAAIDEASKFGGVVRYDGKNSHAALTLCVGNQCLSMGFSCTPKSGDNIVHWIRQQIRQMKRKLDNV